MSALARIRKGTGVYGVDVWVTLKIVRVEREQMSHGVNFHSGGQPCVIYLNAADGMGHNETPPFVVDGFAIRQEYHALSIVRISRSASAGVKPKPFRSAGRVATFQNSAIF